STLDASVGSQAGKPYPNNDFSAVRVYRDLPPGPENWFRKQVHGPYSAGNSIWETANLQITEGSQIVDRTFYPAGGGLGQYGVAPGAELDAVLIMHTDLASSAPEGVDSVLIVGDVWDPSEQAYDASRGSIIVTGPGGVIDPVYYRLEWTDQEVTSEQLLDPASTGWIGGEPTSAARAVRLVFAPDVIPTGSQDGAGLFQVFLPISIPAPSLSADSSQLLDTGAGAIIGTDTPAVDFPAAVLLRQPPTPKLGIVNQITDPWGGGNIATGARVTYQVTAAIDGVPDTSAPLAPTITVELDRCVLNPVNTSIGWAMTVTPAVPDPVSGTVCEGENSVPATLTFTPLAPYTPTWTNRLTGTATLGTISYTVQVADIAAMSMSVTNIATIGIDEEGVADAQQSKDFTVTYRQNDAAALEALVQKVEISQDLTWRAEIYSIDGTIDGAGGSTDTVITLPRNNDSLLVDDLDCDPGQCDGPLASQYQGTYILASASFDLENTTDRAVLYYTTDPDPGLTPGALEWLPLAADDHDSWKSATALRVVMTAGDTVSSAVLNITLTPSSNEPGDAYVMWIGDTSNENSEETSQPCPKAIEVVASTISGTVWWDGNSDGVQNHSEAGIAGVTVTLHEDDGGSPGEEVASTTTNGDGFYEFDLLNSGQYLVVAQRGTQIPDSVETYYGRAKPIAATYAYLSRFGPKAVAAGDQSTVITLGVGAVQPDVDFGYAYPQPMVAFDKTEATITCAAGICEVAWDLVVTNQGNTALDDLTIYDRLPAEAIDPTIAAVIPAGFKQIAANSYNAWAITDDGVWGWGYNYNTWPTPNSPPLGDGSGSVTPYSEATEYLSPTRITTLDGRNVASIVANNTNAWAITDDGVWGWGLNTTVNPLGDGDPGTARLTPVRISVLDGKTVYSIVATEYNSWAITDDGLWGWGANTAFNPLGDGSGSPQSSPVRITGLDGLTVLGLTVSANKTISTTATGSNSAWAITDDGVWGWGPNTTTYPLGAGAAGTAQPTPVPLTGLDGEQVASI
ncbi:MAG: carboxypeptidase regulatory-like domain-containing protein, partial [Promicromonosporaceae bacterium]|nr:carboxypeptidase regulatory-like domain-containing protein [Promicromonosporaceae bacterium]